MINIAELIYEFLDAQDACKVSIGVIGDVMLDEYYQVDVTRISPEYPIPVMNSNNSGQPTAIAPGGAANVARQLQPFNTEVRLFGCMDNEAKKILQQYELNVISVDNGIEASRKKRFYKDDNVVLARWDIEDCSDPNSDQWNEARKELLDEIELYVEKYDLDIMILSDYGKGLFHNGFAEEVISLCNDLDIPTLVDPKCNNLNQWKNCTIFKPNYVEASHFAEDGYIADLVRELECEAVVVTQGRDGVYTYVKDDLHSHYKLMHEVDARSVIGAGDCFAALYALAYAYEFSFKQCSIIAHNAGAIYVQDLHNEPVTPYKIEKALDPIEVKLQKSNTLAKFLHDIPGKKVFTNGCFDLLHSGHIETLRFAKEQGDILIVAVDTDANVKRLKGSDRPIMPLSDRMMLLASLQFVDFVVSFDGNPDNVLKKIGPINVLVKGGDYTVDNVIGAELVDEVIICPKVAGRSTTKIIERIKDE